MPTAFDARLSDSPLIERIWRTRSDRGGALNSIAAGHWELIFSQVAGEMQVSVRGPETVPIQAECPAQGEWLAIRFRAGTFFAGVPTAEITDGRDLELGLISKQRFGWKGSVWEIPSFDNAEALVQRWQREGLIQRDQLVMAAAQGLTPDQALPVSARTLQRRFLAVTGLPLQTFRQIEKARYAAYLLRSGRSSLETALEAGYYDQPHLTRSLRRFTGLTPKELAAPERQLSFLYKPDASACC